MNLIVDAFGVDDWVCLIVLFKEIRTEIDSKGKVMCFDGKSRLYRAWLKIETWV
jgi:hypothetical protein